MCELKAALLPQPDKPSSYPLADALFQAVGSKLDAGEKERALFSHVADHLWTGEFLLPSSTGKVSQPYVSKARLERLLVKASETRERYHTELHNVGDIRDLKL